MESKGTREEPLTPPRPVRARALTVWSPLLFCLVGVAMLASFGVAGGSLAGFPLDDAWIHQVVARTFSETGTLGYAPGEHGAAATSYFWALLLSVNYRFVHANPVYFTFFLNALAYLGSLWLVVLLFRSQRAVATPSRGLGVRLLFSVLFAGFGANYLWFAYSGMEALAFVALSAAALFFFGKRGDRNALLAGICAALLALTRPEAAPLGLLLALLHRRFGRSLREVALLLAPWTLALAAYVGSNLYYTGHASPATLGGRRWLWTGENIGLPRWMHVQEFLDVWGMRLRDYSLGTSSVVALFLALGLAAFGIVVLVRRAGTGGRVFLLWGVFHLGFYVVLMPTPGHGGRYQPLIPLFFMLGLARGTMAVAAALYRCVLRQKTSVLPAFALAATLPWVALTAVGVRDFSLYNKNATAHIQATEVALGRAIDALPEGAKVASFDIGGSGYAAHRHIFDLGGLSKPDVAERIMRGRIADVLRDEHVDYVVVPETYERELPVVGNFAYRLHVKDNPELVLSEVTHLESTSEVWGSGIAATWNASPLQAVYHVTYTNIRASVAEIAARGSSFDPGTTSISAREQARVEASLSFLPQLGVPVELVLGAGVSPVSRAGFAVRIALAKERIQVEVPKRLEMLAPPQELEARLSKELAPFMKEGDLPGAARMVPHCVARVAAAHGDMPRIVTLPPARDPHRRGLGSDVAESAAWGIPLTLLTLLLSLLASRRPRRTG